MGADRRFVRHQEALVALLRKKGIDCEVVLKAMGTVPRECFIAPGWHHRAYRDEALPIGLQQTISQPFTVAYQTMLLEVEPGARVLEIGTGSGYQAAVLSEMGARVFSVERHQLLHERARKALEGSGYRVLTRHGDGSHGWSACAPFDGIVVTAGAPVIPECLVQQLRVPGAGRKGGRLVVPVGGRREQTMTRLRCMAPGKVTREEFHTFRFVPLVSD